MQLTLIEEAAQRPSRVLLAWAAPDGQRVWQRVFRLDDGLDYAYECADRARKALVRRATRPVSHRVTPEQH